MKNKIIKITAGLIAGLMLLGGCDVLPKGTDGPREVPTTITADFTKKEGKGNWVKYGDCKVTLKDGSAVVTDRKASNTGVAVPCPDYRGNTIQASAKATTDNDSLTLTLKYEIFGNVSYVNIVGGGKNESGAIELSGQIEIPANATDAMVYLEANNAQKQS